MIHLSSRLAAVAALVPQGAAVIDVGTDHGMVPVWLVQSGRASRVLATDIRSGPLQRAAGLVARTGTGARIRLMRTDGLTGIGPEEGDTVLMAGMGGETMSGILAAAPWTRDGALLILEPQSKKAELRRWLADNGYCVQIERLAEDAGRIYPILAARGGVSPAYSAAELHLGLLSQIGRDPLFARYLDVMRARADRAAPYDPATAALLAEYDEIKRRLGHADGTGDIRPSEREGSGIAKDGF